MSNESTMDSTAEPEVPLARQPLIRDPDIFTEFAEIEAKLEEKYGEKATTAVIKCFAKGREKKDKGIENKFDPEWNYRALMLSMLVLVLLFALLRTQRIALWPLLWVAGFSVVLSSWFAGVSFYYGFTTDDTVNNYFLTRSRYRNSFNILLLVILCIRIFFVNDTDTLIYELPASSFFS